MNKIFLTGATGFIGSYIADELCKIGYDILAAKRQSSSMKNCAFFVDKVQWINTDIQGWEEEVVEFTPECIIHSAWIGVQAKDRDNKVLQEKNFSLFQSILNIAKVSKTKKIIAFGSQAEYGYLNSVVSEEKECLPQFAYGKTKLQVMNMLKTFAEQNNVKWYWLRVFSVRGEREGQNWLLPSFEHKLKDPEQKEMDFTLGEQCYSYLSCETLAWWVSKIVKKIDGKSGIYNFSAQGAKPIRQILTQIRDSQRPDFKLNFGALPTRKGQSTIIEGKMDKFFSEFIN
jgi:NAD dependent epimerase/dehydratase family.